MNSFRAYYGDRAPRFVNRNICVVGSHALAWQRVVPVTKTGKMKAGICVWGWEGALRAFRGHMRVEMLTRDTTRNIRQLGLLGEYWSRYIHLEIICT